MDSYDDQSGTAQVTDNGAFSAPVSEPVTPPVSEPVAAPVDEPAAAPAMSSVIVDPMASPVPTEDAEQAEPVVSIYTEVATKIAESKNILIALSADPSVDEMSAAIGLSLFLDRLGKRATAIYSGMTPNALEFLKPEETFETTADALQDFVIALNKEKADHLRYKLDGDYVKVFITPYKTRIAEEDLEFSYGDFNVDLVLALDVANGIDLDSALREHGRIMHDAVIINITTGKPGKFGEIEWSDTKASSVSEMIATLLYNFGGKVKIEKEEATAFLTGIVAATNRFSTAGTRPETMRLASRLMESGANQQLVAKNITPDVDNELLSMPGNRNAKPEDEDPTKLNIEHAGEEGVDETKVVETDVTEKESTLLADLKEAEESLSQAGAEATPETRSDLFKIDNGAMTASETDTPIEEVEKAVANESAIADEVSTNEATEVTAKVADEVEDTTESATSTEAVSGPEVVADEEKAPAVSDGPIIPTVPEGTAETNGTEGTGPSAGASVAPLGPDDHPEKVIKPSSDFSLDSMSNDIGKYGQMLEDALTEAGGSTEGDVSTPIMSSPDDEASSAVQVPNPSMNNMPMNPAFANSPAVPNAPEINGVPQMNYMPMPGEEVLPPPPAPPIDMNAAMSGAMPGSTPAGASPVMPGVLAQPVMTDQVYIPQASDPGAFKIPGA